MHNPAAAGHHGEQFLSELDDQGRGGKRRVPLDPRTASPSPPRGGVRFGSPGRHGDMGSPVRGGGSPIRGGGAALDGGVSVVTDGGKQLPEEVKMHILEKEHNKSTRLGVMQDVLKSLEDDDLPRVRGWLSERGCLL